MSCLTRVILVKKQDNPDFPYYICDLNGKKIRDLKTLGEARTLYAEEIKRGKARIYRDFGKTAKRAFVKKRLPDAPKPTVAYQGPPLGAHTTGMMKMV